MRRRRVAQLVAYVQFLGQGCPAGGGGPQAEKADGRGRPEVRVDPANSAAMQAASADEFDQVAVRNDRCLMHLFVVAEKPPASVHVANQQLAVHEVMAADLVTTE